MYLGKKPFEVNLVREGLSNLVPMENRSEGLHISDLIRSYCIRHNHFESGSGEISQQEFTRMQLGLAFEDALIARYKRTYPGRYYNIGEISTLQDNGEPIFATPDLGDKKRDARDEIKLTWMSSSNSVYGEKFQKYWMQLMAYCKMSKSKVGNLHVCHVNGDYGAMSLPVYNVWRRKFTKRELAENWAVLMNERKHL